MTAAAWPRLDVVVIGAQKAGSTHLADLLGRHPDVYMCPDEVPILEDPFYANSNPAELDAALAGAHATQQRGIHRPSYLGHSEVPARLRSHAPDARVVAVLRDPVDRAISAYSWYLQFALLPVRPAEAGLTALLDGWRDVAYPHAREVLDYGLYGRHLQRWLDVFPRDQVLVIDTGMLGGVELRRELFEFLHLAQSGLAGVHGRTNRGVYDPRRLRFMRARARLAFSWDSTDRYTYRPRRLRRPLGSALAVAATVVDRQLLARVFGNEPPTLSPGLRDRLGAFYEDDARLLANVLGRDPGWRRG